MPMITRKTICLVKIEGTEGTDAAPTTVLDAILVDDVTLDPSINFAERPCLHGTIGQLPAVMGARFYDISLTTELKGAGEAGGVPIAPAWAPLLKSALMAEAVGANTRTYSPAIPGSADDLSCTIWVYRDGLCYKATGCRGTFKIDGKAGERAMLTWTGKGRMSSVAAATYPADVAFPGSATYEADLPAVCNSITGLLHGMAVVCESFGIDIGNEVGDRPSVNGVTGFAGFSISGRSPKLTLNPEATTEAVAQGANPGGMNIATGWWGTLAAGTRLTFACDIIQAAAVGKRIAITAPKAQLRSLKQADRNGFIAYDLEAALTENAAAGCDELVIQLH